MSGSTAWVVFLVVVLVVVIVFVAYQVLKGTGFLKRLGRGPGCIHSIDGFRVYRDRVETPHGVAYFRDGPVTANG